MGSGAANGDAVDGDEKRPPPVVIASQDDFFDGTLKDESSHNYWETFICLSNCFFAVTFPV